MSHLLYLNSRDNYPNKCPHICLHLIVKQHPIPLGLGFPVRGCLTEDAHYTHVDFPCNPFAKINQGNFLAWKICSELRHIRDAQ